MSSLCPPTPWPLSGPLLEAIAASVTVRSFAAHTVLITEQDDTDAPYIILSGRVKACGATDDGREDIDSTQGPGEYFGEMTLEGGPRSARRGRRAGGVGSAHAAGHRRARGLLARDEMVSRVLKPLTVGGYIGQRGGRIALLKKLPARW